jgi:hypothetical protein
MSEEAREHVLALTRDQVTPRQKHLLAAIAEYHNVRYGTANIDLATLCDDILMDRRNLRRMLASLSAFIDYLPGRGRGNYGQFRFVQLVHVVHQPPAHSAPAPAHVVHQVDEQRGLKGGNKRVIPTTAIRKENLKQKPDQDQPQRQHGFAGLHAKCDPQTAKAIDAWTGIKWRFQLSLEPSEFSQWVRPTYVLRVMGDILLLTHPPDGRINEKLRASEELQRLVREAGYGGAKFSVYPDDYELQKLAERFPRAYESIAPALKKRASSAA